MLSAPFLAWLAAPAEAVGLRCVILEAGVKSGGSEIIRCTSTVGFTTEPGDTPANQPYSGRIADVLPFTRRLDLQGSGGSISFGGFVFDNEDGRLDSWRDDIWAGRPINAYMGDAGDETRGIAKWPRSQFELVYSGTSDDIEPSAINRLTLHVRDIFGPLNDTFSTAPVGGEGDNKDALRPVCLGECFNVTPVLLDAATNTYAVHLDSPIEGVIEVRDNGVPVAFTQDAAHGTFTLTNARYGQLTCDVQGAKIDGEWRTDGGGLIEWVATVLGDGNFIASDQIDADALTAFRAACPQPLGLYVTDRGNRLAIMQQLAAAVGATVTTTYDGLLILVRVGLSSPLGAIGPRQIVDGSFVPIARLPVLGAIRLAAERNWTPQTTNIAGIVTAEQLPIFGDEYVTLSATDATVLSDWKQTDTPPAVATLMVVESDVVDEGSRRLDLWSVPRSEFGFDGFPECFGYEIGDTRTLTYPRFGLDDGVDAQIVGMRLDLLGVSVQPEVLV